MLSHRRYTLPAATFVFGLAYMFGLSANAGEVVSVSPTGSVKQIRQVLVRFSTDMVPMGDPRSHKDPFKITCTGKDESKKVVLPKATSRWADGKNWSYDFDMPLTSGISCTLTKTVQTDLKGDPVTALDTYQFSTGGPALKYVVPRYGNIEPDQHFVAQFEGPLDLKSVESIAYFESEKLQGKIGVRVVTGADREKILRAAVQSDWQLSQYKRLLESKKPFASLNEFDSFLVLAAKNRFAEDSKVVLHWPKGILSASQIPVEEPQTFEFQVIPPFEAKFYCERNNPDSPCNPILNAQLRFSRMVDRKLLAQIKLVGPKGVTFTPAEFSEKGTRKTNRTDSDVLDTVTFSAPLPAATKFKVVIPTGMKDELGRTLVNQSKFPLDVATDEFTPLIKFAAPFGILERNADPMLPVSLRNVEKGIAAKKQSIAGNNITIGTAITGQAVKYNSSADAAKIIALYRGVVNKEDSYQSRGTAFINDASAKAISIPKPGGEKDFELIGIPLKEPGLHIVELVSPKLGQALLDGPPMYVASAALVTNMAVHFKKGRESSAVWVTALDTAKPIANADVSVLSSDGKILGSGKTDASGIWRAPTMPYPCLLDYPEAGDAEIYGNDCEVFAFAKKGEDMSFVSSLWTRGIEEYRFNVSNEYLSQVWGPIAAHAVLDRSLLQAGETLHFKVLLRDRTSNGFKAFNSKRIPKRLLIVHRGSNKTYAQPFAYDPKTGTMAGEFKVPKDATLGSYEIFVSAKTDKEKAAASEEGDGEEGSDREGDTFDWQAQSVGDFIVAEYRLPLMTSTVKVQDDKKLVRPSEVAVDLSAGYLSGGPAENLRVKVRSSITGGSFHPDFPGANEYSFFAIPTRAGVADGDDDAPSTDLAFVFNKDVTLGKTGGALTSISGLPKLQHVRTLVVEMEYRDPNGEVKTGRDSTTLYPASTVIGLRPDTWVAKAGKASASGVIVDLNGKPVVGHPYVVEAFKREYITHRKRLVGGFYSYDSSSKTVALGKVCEGKSDARGEFVCQSGKLPSGSISLQARTTDAKGNATYAAVSMSIYEEGDYSWWTPSDSDRIDLLPEKTSYQPGETAKFVLRSPFPVSTVLVTVDREGVLDSFVKEVPRDNPIIEVPLKNHYAPNVFVSALAIRGRVGDVKPTALVDMAKPSMKLGLAGIRVGWKAHELKVTVTPEKKRYRAREKAVATIKVVRADGQPLAGAESEVAIAVVDEALALLRKNWSLDLLANMMRERPLAVGTASAQNQIIGKRHFGSKARPPGGGGGLQSESREFFDPMLLWIPKLKLDANGEAKVTVPLNDSMTSFRINAVAQSGMALFGSGSSVIESSKDLILYSGFAPVVRDGDKIQNALTVRNTTAKPMKVDLTIASKQVTIAKQAPFELKPSEAKVISIPVTVPPDLSSIEFEMVAKDSIGGSSDSLKIKTRVQFAVPDQVLQATLFQLDKPNSIPVQQPKDAIMGRGGLAVDSRSTLLTGLAGVKSYMEDYPYSCMEQRVSKAIALEDKTAMLETIGLMPSYLDASGLLKFFPSSRCGSQALTHYVLSIAKANSYEIPEETRQKVLDGLDNWMNGGTCDNWWSSYMKNSYRDQERLLVMDVLSKYGRYNSEHVKTVNITPNLWKTTAVVALYRLAGREKAFPNRDALLKQTEQILRSRVNFQGSLMNLQGGLDWDGRWALFTSDDQEALTVFGLAVDMPSWQSDVGRFARGVTARLKRGKWDSTMANAWGVTELRRFSAKFEKEKVAGTTTVSATGVNSTVDWTKKPGGEKSLLKWPTGSEAKPVPVSFTHQGAGKPWIMLQTRSAIPLLKPLNLGYSISRKVTKILPTGGDAPAGAAGWKNGDVANIELTITAQADQPWVVIRDPIPAGASHLGTGLSGESGILDRAPKKRPRANEVSDWPEEFVEKSQSHFISYAAYLMKGTYKTNYRIRLNSSGTMKLPPSHVEALYSPETFADAPVAPWSIAP